MTTLSEQKGNQGEKEFMSWLNKQRINILIFLVVSITFFAIFVLIPVFTIAGNSLAFQLSLYKPFEFLLLAFLAILIGLIFSLQIYAIRAKKHCSVPKTVAQGATTGATGIFAGILGTAVCASCLISLFAAVGLGTGSLFFVLENQIYFLIGAVVIMLIFLYFALRQVIKIQKDLPY